MPQHKGFEPSTRIWVVQVYQKQQVSTWKDPSSGATMTWLLKLKVLPTEQDYTNYKTGLTSSQTTGIATDYGMQLWRNKKTFISGQFDNVYINGNWIPNFNP
jgi:hypothetical protein